MGALIYCKSKDVGYNKNMVDPQLEIENIKNQLIAKYMPERIILFGSHAWGNPRPDSDIDLCVIKKGVETEGSNSRKLEINRMFDHRVATDVLVYSPYEVKRELWLGNPFIKKIIDNGRGLYDASASN